MMEVIKMQGFIYMPPEQDLGGEWPIELRGK